MSLQYTYTSNLQTTQGGNFNYPAYTDTPDVPRDIYRLATELDSYLAVNKGPGYLVFSSSSNTFSLGSKTFSVSINANNPNGSGAYAAGDRVRIINTANSAQFIEGIVTSVTTNSSITVNIDTVLGSGTITTWQFSLTGIQGIQGPQGPQGTQGVQGVQGPQGTQGIQGVQGPQGTQGVQGVQGTQGVQGSGYSVTTSTTSVTVGTGAQTFTITSPGAFIAGDRVRVVDTANTSIFMEGTISSISSTSLTMNVDMVSGSGTIATWKFSIAGVQGVQGPQGLQGVQGTQGPQGTQGIQGIQGPQGTQGVQGPQGTQGIQGVQGPQGTQGVQGVQGPQGTQGIQGRSHIGVTSVTSNTIGQGSKTFAVTYSGDFSLGENVIVSNTAAPSNYVIGNITALTLDSSITVNVTTTGGSGTYTAWTFASSGIQGVQGTQGVQGPQGTQGIQGVQGPQGTQGVQGLQGIQGPQGTQGIQGVQGPQGTQGIQGIQGPQGLQGIQGPQGTQGIQGPQGTQGVQGLQGVQGPQGTQGVQGPQGTQGVQGVQGPQGTQGVQGIAGIAGQTNAHAAVNAVSTNNLPTTYAAGTTDVESGTGVGATITANANGVLPALDGVTLVVGNRVLFTGRTNPIENGIYTVTSVGSSSTKYQFTRATDYDNHVSAQVESGDYVFVLTGTLYAGSTWVQYNVGSNLDKAIRIGTDSILFTETAGIGAQGLTGPTGAGGVNAYWGSFWDTTTQTAANTTTAYPININNTDPNSFGVSISNSNRINFANSGTYNIQYSIQFNSSDSNGDNVDVWISKNGTDVADSNSIYGIPGTSHGGTGAIIAAINYVLKLNAGDYIQLMWATSSTSVQIQTVAAASNPTVPETPGVIVTATQVTYQGIQGTQGLSVQGTQGLQGPQGTQGLQGLQGTQGVQGIQGIQGPQGTQGIQGIQGPQGTQGLQGLQGVQGPQGTQGLQGIQGTQGTQGLQGLQGLQGNQGIQGFGYAQLQGVQGTAGASGVYTISSTPPSPAISGQAWINSNDGRTYIYDGTEWYEPYDNLSGLQGVAGPSGLVSAATAPTNTSVLWLDTTATAVAPVSHQLISSGNLTATAVNSFSVPTGGYKKLELTINGWNVNQSLQYRINNDSGNNYANNPSGMMNVMDTVNTGGANDQAILRIYNPESTNQIKMAEVLMTGPGNAVFGGFILFSWTNSSTAVSSIQVLFGGGGSPSASATYTLYGIL